MSEQNISQSSAGKASNQIHSSDHNNTVIPDRSISQLIAEDTMRLTEILSKSSMGYQTF